MGSFNQRRLERLAADIPNGTSVATVPNGSTLPNGQPMPQQGVMLSSGDPNPAGAGEGKTPLRDVIGDILFESQRGASDEEVSAIAKTATNSIVPPELVSGNDDLASLISALGRRANEDPSKTTRNLATDEMENSIADLARDIAEQASSVDPTWGEKALLDEAAKRKSGGTRTAGRKGDPEEQKKKKTSGNPFRVLMGLIGKMLDHGMKKGEIVRKVLKQRNNSWQRETVQKCVDIVKDYSRREHRKKSEEATAMASNTFNPRRYAQRQLAVRGGEQSRPSVYDVTRDVGLMSTQELLLRYAYLSEAKKGRGANENNPGNRDVDTGKVRSELKTVAAEIRKRGIAKEDLEGLMGLAVEPSDKTVGEKG